MYSNRDIQGHQNFERRNVRLPRNLMMLTGNAKRWSNRQKAAVLARSSLAYPTLVGLRSASPLAYSKSDAYQSLLLLQVARRTIKCLQVLLDHTVS